MRVLGIETSTRRGSLALVENGELVAEIEHSEPNAHAERLVPLLGQLLARGGVARTSLDRVAVGIGPGSFVGLRVGIALAEGLGLGLGRPVVGVPSLLAMLSAVPRDCRATRVALVDARRGELFVSAQAAEGRELASARALPRAEVESFVAALAAPVVLVGEVAAELELGVTHLRGAELDLPAAAWVARLGAECAPEASPPSPLYVRGPGAALPKLPASPFAHSETPSE
jgi:tRNA threonylcarbamoyladenosine biosynthesis protein TsaB